PTAGLRVDCGFEMSEDRPARVTTIDLRLRLPAEFPEERRAALGRVIEHCTVHNTLRLGTEVRVGLESVPAAAGGASGGDGRALFGLPRRGHERVPDLARVEVRSRVLAALRDERLAEGLVVEQPHEVPPDRRALVLVDLDLAARVVRQLRERPHVADY